MKNKIRFSLPPRSEIARLVRSVRSDICPDYRASEGDETPGICLTIGANRKGNWNFQTGDNSFTGGAYGFASWAVASVYKDSNSFAVADEILDELGEALHSEMESEQWIEERAEEKALRSAGLHHSQKM